MQRLLADAEKLTGVKYDINNLSDVYQAIHAIQENLDITGTTAKEAASTFTGSFNAMKAAAQNVLGKLALGENILPSLQALAETTSTFLFNNFFPMIGNIMSGLGVVISEGLSHVATQLFGEEFGNAVFTQLSRVSGIFQTFFDMIFGSLSKQDNIDILEALGFSEGAATQIVNIAENIRETFINIGSAIGDVLGIVGDFVGDLLGIKDGEQGVNLLGVAFEALTSALRIVSSILKEITNFFKENKLAADLLKTAIVALGVGMPIVKIASFVTALGGIPGIFAVIQTVISGFATSITAAISAIPLVGWIAAAVAALVWFFTQTETGRQIWSDFVEWIKQAWQGIADFFVNLWSGISEGANTLWDGVSMAWNAYIESLKLMWSNIVTFFSDLWVSVQETASTAWTLITTAIMTVVQPFIDGFMNIWNNISSGLTQIWEGIKMIFQGVWEVIKSIFLGAVLIIIDLVTGNFTQLGADLSLIWEGIKNGISLIWEGIKTYFSGVVDAIIGFVVSAFENLSTTLSTIWEGIKTVAVVAWEWIKSTVSNLITGLVQEAQNIWNSFTSFLSSLWESIKSTASSAWETLKSSVLSAINSLVSGAQSAWDTMSNAVSSLVSSVTGFFNQLWNIDLYGAGQAILQGFLNGLQSMWSSVTSFVGGIASWIRDHKGPIEYDRKLLIPAGNAIMQGLDGGLKDRFKDVKKTVNGVAGEIADVFSGNNLDLDTSSAVTRNLQTTLDVSSAQLETQESAMASEIANLRTSMENILTAILEKPTDTYLDGEKISWNSYQRQGAFFAREGI